MNQPVQPLLVASNLGRRNGTDKRWLFRGVDLTLAADDRLALVGPTGVGKTVLMRSLALLDPLDSGAITFEGRPVQGELVPYYRSRVIYLHQRPALDRPTVEEALRQPFALKVHRSRSFDRERAAAVLDRLGRPPTFLNQACRDLSGGEAQIVALVRALLLDPQFLLLDEPTASLDRVATRLVEEFLAEWYVAGRGECGYVFVSHDPDQTLRMSSRRLLVTPAGLAPDHPQH